MPPEHAALTNLMKEESRTNLRTICLLMEETNWTISKPGWRRS